MAALDLISERWAKKRYRVKSQGKGFTLLEIIVAIFILGVAIVPMLQAYLPAFNATNTREETLIFANQAGATLNRAAALDFATLNSRQGNPVDLVTLFGSVAEAAKETFTLNGKSYSPVVSVTDASGGAGGLLQLTVTVGDVSLTTLKADY